MLWSSNEFAKKHYENVVAWARSNGLLDKLQRQLDYLDTYAEVTENGREIGRTVCMLTPDGRVFGENEWAQPSFGFNLYSLRPGVRRVVDPRHLSPAVLNQRYTLWFVGGLIFHGAGSSGVGAPEFAVRIGDCSEADWSIHT